MGFPHRKCLSRSILPPCLTVALVIAAVAGCTKKVMDPNRAYVSGKVKFAGQFLPKGTIKFYAKELGGDSAVFGGDGYYSLSLRPGTYQVAVVAKDGVDTMDAKSNLVLAKSLIPEQYTDVATSGLMATLTCGKNTFDLDLRP